MYRDLGENGLHINIPVLGPSTGPNRLDSRTHVPVPLKMSELYGSMQISSTGFFFPSIILLFPKHKYYSQIPQMIICIVMYEN